MKKFQLQPNEQQNEQGIASILITLIMMIVLTIIVLSFATASRREQTQALDDQLSSAAFYAAESGINDARQAIATILASDPTGGIPPKNNCISKAGDTNPDDSRYFNLTNSLDTADDVEYSCLLINPQPQSLVYAPLTAGAHVIPLNAGASASSGTTVGFNTITLTWTLPNDVAASLVGSPLAGCPSSAVTSYTQFQTSLPPGCKLGELRVDLVPVPTGTFTVGSLMQSTTSAFLIPTQDGGSGALTAGSQGSIVPANCTDTGASSTCSVTVSNMGGIKNYVMRVQWLYHEVNLTITGVDSGGASMFLNGAQVVIDSTGVANQVQRRIQVRFSTASSDQPAISDAIQSSNSICKRFIITPNLGAANATTENPVPGAPFAFNFNNSVTGCGDAGTGSTTGGGGGGGSGGGTGGTGGGLGSGSGSNPTASENAFESYFNDASLGYPIGRVPISCFYDWGDGTPNQSIPVAQCESYATAADADAAGGFTQHNYCKQSWGGYPGDTGPGAVDCSQLPACPPGPAGSPNPDSPYLNLGGSPYAVQLDITDSTGTTIIRHTTNPFPECD